MPTYHHHQISKGLHAYVQHTGPETGIIGCVVTARLKEPRPTLEAGNPGLLMTELCRLHGLKSTVLHHHDDLNGLGDITRIKKVLEERGMTVD